MRVKRLQLDSYRGFKSLALDLDRDLTVLVGVNGAGKSSVLDCLAVLLSQVSTGILTRAGHGRRFSESDIRQDASYALGQCEASFDGTSATWSVALVRPGHPARVPSSLVGLRDVIQRAQEGIQRGDVELPLAIYYPVNRAVLDIPRRIRKRHKFEPLSAFDEALLGGGSNFRLFFEWFREQEDLENERKAREPLLFKEDPQLASVRSAVERLVPGFSEPHVQRAPHRMVVEKGGRFLEIDQLSDGEKCLLALAGDLARRLALANPKLHDPLTAKAVVLIDEIELHLHPAWQRNVIDNLRRTFPQCQFVVTTHSPQVLSAVPSKSVVVLEDFAVTSPAANTEGRDSNSILSEVLGVPERPQATLDELQNISRLIDSESLEEASIDVARLAQTLGERDAEITRLRALIALLSGPPPTP